MKFILGLIFVLVFICSGYAFAGDHKGATFPLETVYLPDCSLYIDPKEAEMYSHCEKFNTSYNKKWHGYLEFMGKPGTARSLGQADLFFPLAQDENDMTFFNVRGHVDFGSDNNEYNIGFGHRHMFDKFILGAYGYYDHRFTDVGSKFNQVTLGLEVLSETWDFRANGYIPENKTETILDSANVEVVRLPHDQIEAQVTGVFHEKALPGLDLEMGYKLPMAKHPGLNLFEDTRLFLGGYHFLGSGNYESITGPRIRLETRLHDIPGLGMGSRLMLGIETQYDNPRGSQTAGILSFRIPFGVGQARSSSPLKGLDRRMMESVVRDVDIVASQADVPIEYVPVFGENGKEITKVVDVEWIAQDGETRAETDERIRLTVNEKMQSLFDEGETGIVFVKGEKEATKTVMTWDTHFNILGNQMLSGAGEGWEVDYLSKTLGRGKVIYTEPGTSIETTGAGCWTMTDGSQLNGWSINAAGCEKGYGIEITTAGNYFVTNSTIKNAQSHGIYVHNEDKLYNAGDDYELNEAVLYLSQSEISNNGKNGIQVGVSTNNYTIYRGGTLIAENLFIDGNGKSGLKAVGQWSHVTLTGTADSRFLTEKGYSNVLSNNAVHGVALGEGAIGIFDSIESLNNTQSGVSSSYRDSGVGSHITLTNSFLSGNFNGIDVNYGATMIADNVISTKNRGHGADIYGYFTATNSEFTDNLGGIRSYTFDPAPVYVLQTGWTTIVTLDNVLISGNRRYGIASIGGITIVTNSIIENNNPNYYRAVAGGKWYVGGYIQVEDCVLPGDVQGGVETCE